MARQRSRDTKVELAIRRILHRDGYRYRVHVRPSPGLRCVADIAFGPAKVAVMIDGCFWHGCPDHSTWPKANAEWWRTKIEGNRERDASMSDALAEAGWLVVRVWEHEIPEQAADRIVQAVDARRSVRRSGNVGPVT